MFMTDCRKKITFVQDNWILRICQLCLWYGLQNNFFKEDLNFAHCVDVHQASKRENVCVNNLYHPVWCRQIFNQKFSFLNDIPDIEFRSEIRNV